MPFEIRPDHDRKVVFVIATSPVTAEGVRGYHQDVLANPELRGYDELGDYTGVTGVELSTDLLRAFALEAGRILKELPRTRLALVISHDVTFGMARMYAVFAEFAGDLREIRVFRGVEEAREWLGLEGGEGAEAAG